MSNESSTKVRKDLTDLESLNLLCPLNHKLSPGAGKRESEIGQGNFKISGNKEAVAKRRMDFRNLKHSLPFLEIMIYIL